MAEWLLSTQQPTGGFPAGTYTGGDTEPSVFNTGQILRGLVRTHRETDCNDYRESAISAVEWLAEVQNNDGSWDKFDYYGTSHTYSSRVSWPVLEVSAEYDLDIGQNIAYSNLSWVLTQQRTNGWFNKIGFDRSDKAYLHTIAYTIRGLLESADILTGELASRCERAAKVAADKLLTQQNTDGILPGVFNSEWTPAAEFRCLTGNAQMAIIWERFFEQTKDTSYKKAVDETIRYLTTVQTFYGSNQIYGGIRGSDPVWGRYMYFRYPNWAVKFFIDMLLLCDTKW